MAILSSENTKQAFNQWLDDIRRLVFATRPYRRRICVLDIDLLIADPSSVSDQVLARFKLSRPGDLQTLSSIMGKVSGTISIDPGAQIIAEWLLLKNTEAMALAAELRAMIANPSLSKIEPFDLADESLSHAANVSDDVTRLLDVVQRSLIEADEARNETYLVQTEKEELAAQNDETAKENHALVEEKTALAEEARLLRESMNFLLGDFEKAEGARQRLEKELASQAAEIGELSEQRNILKGRVAELDNEVSDLKKQHRQSANELKNRIAEIAQERDELFAEKTALVEKNWFLADELEHATADLDMATRDKNQLRHQQDALRDEIAALHQSTSWRITAPLRKIRLGLSRLAPARSAQETHAHPTDEQG
ncbi:hypothetical protein JQU17_22945 [Ponticoccus sp. SC2-23]|uniref:hypothetical protein n=1 Tax=Alexandriicola marinus TaxID=2081710 RepID=UPI000FD9336A|nr:hypothetical protein [Alexandriicola marinus]MBM1223004.1 hypothetical protein [Ponticoccus sp. SC6-9]MBM1227496.1 hypothetical protein [Ponticoccus sp. SC6-15]MBM1232013.1 hypothetical protein [Ponticoccus sp. SC6-38]MBM1236517.1 hypothetical protein [Ponticoccus sp. SC6-45]MBM1241025.1 hypothetical protein [Ponticoccus sp. SC6-49]MBM1245487.1 hypothetical protein [Ponticoccus sp. SC2-64]MBM1254475.1 hypothetical protein [Ponticoccus sp. SC6-33]MBM1259033.1 hypothetical protein [Pontico